MAENKQKKHRTGFFDVFTKLLSVIKLQELRPYQKFNIIMSMLTALVILVLVAPPALSLVNGILVTLFNFLLSIFGRQQLASPAGVSASTRDTIICFIVLLAEFIICHFFCFRAIKTNSPPPPPPPEVRH